MLERRVTEAWAFGDLKNLLFRKRRGALLKAPHPLFNTSTPLVNITHILETPFLDLCSLLLYTIALQTVLLLKTLAWLAGTFFLFLYFVHPSPFSLLFSEAMDAFFFRSHFPSVLCSFFFSVFLQLLLQFSWELLKLPVSLPLSVSLPSL